jgi:hypothetical protein
MVAAGSAVAPCAVAADSMAVAAFMAAVDSTAADADKFHTSIHTRGSSGRQEILPAVFFFGGEVGSREKPGAMDGW